MKVKIIFFIVATLISFNSDALPYSFHATQQQELYQTLLKEIRCVVCQNQNLADSEAPLAKDLRYQIYQQIILKKTAEEIKLYLTKRYGDFILLNPPFNQVTFFLWFFPLIGMFITILIFTRFIKMKSFP